MAAIASGAATFADCSLFGALSGSLPDPQLTMNTKKPRRMIKRGIIMMILEAFSIRVRMETTKNTYAQREFKALINRKQWNDSANPLVSGG